MPTLFDARLAKSESGRSLNDRTHFKPAIDLRECLFKILIIKFPNQILLRDRFDNQRELNYLLNAPNQTKVKT